jgi:hypothetical protein
LSRGTSRPCALSDSEQSPSRSDDDEVSETRRFRHIPFEKPLLKQIPSDLVWSETAASASGSGFSKLYVAKLKDPLKVPLGTDMSDVTQILSAIEQGDPQESEGFCPKNYGDWPRRRWRTRRRPKRSSMRCICIEVSIGPRPRGKPSPRLTWPHERRDGPCRTLYNADALVTHAVHERTPLSQGRTG